VRRGGRCDAVVQRSDLVVLVQKDRVVGIGDVVKDDVKAKGEAGVVVDLVANGRHDRSPGPIP